MIRAMLADVAVFIPTSWFEPLPEWARVPLLVGTFIAFAWVVVWAIRQRRR
jgi:hypothetical protein